MFVFLLNNNIIILSELIEVCEDWSDWVDAQADMSRRWAHRSFC